MSSHRHHIYSAHKRPCQQQLRGSTSCLSICGPRRISIHGRRLYIVSSICIQIITHLGPDDPACRSPHSPVFRRDNPQIRSGCGRYNEKNSCHHRKSQRLLGSSSSPALPKKIVLTCFRCIFLARPWRILTGGGLNARFVGGVTPKKLIS